MAAVISEVGSLCMPEPPAQSAPSKLHGQVAAQRSMHPEDRTPRPCEHLETQSLQRADGERTLPWQGPVKAWPGPVDSVSTIQPFRPLRLQHWAPARRVERDELVVKPWF